MKKIRKPSPVAAVKTSVTENNCNKNRKGSIRGTAIRFVPNCREFKIKLKGLDPLAKIFGLNLNITPEIEITPYENRAINQYLDYMVGKLQAEPEGQPEVFWKTAAILMKSDSYLVASMGRVFPQWHRHHKLTHIVRIAMETTYLIKTKSTDLEFRRVYIPKSDGTSRPLGFQDPRGGSTYTCEIIFYQSF